MKVKYDMGKLSRNKEEAIKVEIGGKVVALSNLDKIYFPESQITKGELIKFYTDMAPYILPHIKRHPFVMVRYPEGIYGDFFYQKQCPVQAPDWVTRFTDPNSENELTYVVCDRLSTLVYLINLGCIEIHSWAATCHTPLYPEWAVFDLDPDPPSGLPETLEVARWLGDILHELSIEFLVKTSGVSGIHLLVPLEARYTYEEIQKGVGGVCRFLANQRSQECTTERSTKHREGKVYLDYLQNGRGRTMAGIYSVRPTPFGNVSAPLLWEEVEGGVEPERFNVRNMLDRIRTVGDLSCIMQRKNDFSRILHYFTK
jgi:bifunctional non-homologous end joining protein LigD